MGSYISVLVRHCRLLLRFKKPFQQPSTTPAGNPLPPVIHQRISRHQLGPGRLVLIGDVHGCYDELLELLSKVQFIHGSDNLILVGDLVNKGPKSAEVVAAVRQWCQQGKAWVVRGNHDDSALAARQYLRQGLGPVKPKYHWVNGLQPQDVEFLSSMPFSLEVEGYNVLVVHAGLVPDQPLQQQALVNLTKMRELLRSPDGSWVGLEKGQEGSQAWAECWQGPHHVFFGHDAKRRLQNCTYATGLDTGCVYGGQLTACVLPPLSELQDSGFKAASQNTSSSSRAKSGLQEGSPTLDDLKGRLVSVMGGSVYDKPGK